MCDFISIGLIFCKPVLYNLFSRKRYKLLRRRALFANRPRSWQQRLHTKLVINRLAMRPRLLVNHYTVINCHNINSPHIIRRFHRRVLLCLIKALSRRRLINRPVEQHSFYLHYQCNNQRKRWLIQ